MQNLIFSCDWGTSSFRLKLVDVNSMQVIGETSSGKGIAEVYNSWKSNGGHEKISKKEYFLQHLKENIDCLSVRHAIALEETPVIVSGMACSSIGMEELPYASLPFSIGGSNAVVRQIADVGDFGNKVWLISGISNKKDVMRGEETQMIGLAKSYSKVFRHNNTICIFPGTHSKHIRVQHGEIVDFQTYMTGELFYLMTNHSILKDSISRIENDQALTGSNRKAFQQGVHRSEAANLLHDLFSVRTNQLFKYWNKEENYFYLSGLLIGTELRSLAGKGLDGIVLCCGSKIHQSYQLAMESLGLMDKAIVIPPERVDSAFIDGQIEIINQQLVELK